MTEAAVDLLGAMPLDAALVLEVGCGAGALGRAYRRRNPRAVYAGVERRPDRASQASAHLDAVVGGDIEDEAVLARLDRLRDGRLFDLLVFGDGVLDALAHPAELLGALRSRMAPQATCAASVADLAQKPPLSAATTAMFRAAGWTITDARRPTPINGDVNSGGPKAEAAIASEAAPAGWIVRCVNGPARPPLAVVGMTPRRFAGNTHVRTEEPLAALASRPGVWPRWEAETLRTSSSGVPGVLLFQRMFLNEPEIWEMVEKRIAQGWVVVSDIDDDPRHFPVYVETDFRAFRGVHAVTVSTEPLARLLRPFNPNVFVLPNAVDALPDPPPATPKSGDRLRLLFGALNRGDDWAPMIDRLRSALAALADRVEVMVIHDQAFFDALPAGVPRRFFPTLAYPLYKRALTTCDIALLPLADTEFNRYKSDIKLVECCAAGVVPVCSPVVYGDDPRNAAVSVMVERLDGFADAVTALCLDLPRLARLRAAGRAYVAAERMQAYGVRPRETLYRQLMAGHAALEAQRRQRLAP